MTEQLRTFLTDNTTFITRSVWTIIIILGLWLVRRIILKYVDKHTENPEFIYTWRKSTEFITLLLGVFAVATVWLDGNGFQSASTYFGLLSAGLAIALQDPLVNFFGWVFIFLRRPFEVGDRIEINGISGDVIDLHYFQFSLLEIGNWVHAEQSTGRIIRVPNRLIFNQAAANYTTGVPYIWNELPVEVTFESDWQAAKKVLEQIAQKVSPNPDKAELAQIRRMAKRTNIRLPQTTPVVYVKVASSGVILTLRYLCMPQQRRTTEHELWQAILLAFASHDDIDFAYPTHRFFSHPDDGKTLLTNDKP